MPFTAPPPLPAFLAAQLPFPRRAYVLERGVDAGRSLHFLDAGPAEAQAVLLLHGNPTWSFLWRKVIAGLPAFRPPGGPQTSPWLARGERPSTPGGAARAYRWPLRRFRDRIAPLALARLVPTGREHPSFALLDAGSRWAQAFEGPMTLVW